MYIQIYTSISHILKHRPACSFPYRQGVILIKVLKVVVDLLDVLVAKLARGTPTVSEVWIVGQRTRVWVASNGVGVKGNSLNAIIEIEATLNNLLPLRRANAEVFKNVLLYDLALFVPEQIVMLEELADAPHLSTCWGIVVRLALLIAHLARNVHKSGIDQ